MTPRVAILPAADADLDDQAVYLGRVSGQELAQRFLDAADRTFGFLADNPGLGAPRHASNPVLEGVRVWRLEEFKNHLVFYRPIEDGVEIVRVLHGHRDLASIFGPEDGS